MLQELRELLNNHKSFHESENSADPTTLVFKIRINYVSGIQEEMWCTEFRILPNGTYEWNPLNSSKRPLFINVEKIESVYQVDIGSIPTNELLRCKINIDGD